MRGCWLRLGVLALLGTLWGAAGARAAPLPSCTSHIEVSGIKIIRVERNGVLVLSDGRAVDLEGVLLPNSRRDHAPDFAGNRALATLRRLATGRVATLAASRPKEDRYGRIRAQVFFPTRVTANWLQVAMLRRGWARVNIMPDRRECARQLLAAEREARIHRRGLWALPAYAVRRADAAGGAVGTFQIVEGVVRSAEVRNGRAYLNFGSDWRTDFTATIGPASRKLFRRLGINPRDYAGKRVRVRGWMQSLHGPEIEVADPEAIEVLGPARVRGVRPRHRG